MYPVAQVFDWDKWQDGFDKHWRGDQNESIREEFRTFKKQVLENFKYYRVPVIALDRSTSKEAVCVVFEKVNTGGKPLDAFELVTAMYAASGHELRKDWYGDDGTKGRHRRFAETLRPAGLRRRHHRRRRQHRLPPGRIALPHARAAARGGASRQAGQGIACRHRQPAGAVEPAARCLQAIRGAGRARLRASGKVPPHAAHLPDFRSSLPVADRPAGGDPRRHRRCVGARGQPREAGAVVLERRLRRAVRVRRRDPHRARLHGGAGLAEGRPGALDGQRDDLPRRPT